MNKKKKDDELMSDESERNYRAHCCKIAKQLHYDKEIIDRIKNAKNDTEICNLMIAGRHRLED